MARIANIAQLRAGLGDSANDYSDEELLRALSASTGIALPQAAEKFGYDTAKGPWTERGASAVDSYQAGLYGLGEAVGGTSQVGQWMGKHRRGNEIAAQIESERAKAGGIPDDWRDINGVGSAARYVGGLAVDSLPYMAESVTGGIAGRVVAGGLRGMEALSGAERATLVSRSGTAGGVLASVPSSIGDVLSNQRDQAGETNLGTAIPLGFVYAGLNAFGESRVANTLHGPRAGIDALDRMSGLKGGAARAGVAGARLGVEEGLSETGQEAMNQMGRMSVDPNETFFSENAQKRYTDAFVGGAALGGVLGPAQGGWRRSEHYRPSSSPLDASSDEAPPGPSGPINMLGYDPSVGNGRMYVFPDGSVATGEEAAFGRRYAPQPGVPPAAPALGYDPNAGKGLISFPDGSVGRPEDVEGYNEQRFQQQYAPQPADLSLATTTPAMGGMPARPGPINLLNATAEQTEFPGRPDPTQYGNEIAWTYPEAQMPGGRTGSLNTEGLDVVNRAQMGLEPAPMQVAQENAQGDTEQPPLDVKPPESTEAKDAQATNQMRIQASHEAIGRAQEAGMKTDKQQTAFWRAEELAKQGKLSESKLTQVMALLAQSMFPKATKIMDEAAVGVGHDDLQAKYKAIDKAVGEMDKHAGDMSAATAEIEALKGDPEAKPQQVAKAKAKLAAASAKYQAASDHVKQLKASSVGTDQSNPTVAPIAVRDAPAGTMPASAPAPAKQTASALSQRVEQANKVERYKALLACLTRK